MQSAISGSADDISGIPRTCIMMTYEDFDGRLNTYAIGIKLTLGPNLQVCNPNLQLRQDGAKLALAQTCKTCSPSVPSADPGVILRVKPARRPRIYRTVRHGAIEIDSQEAVSQFLNVHGIGKSGGQSVNF